MSIQVVSDPGMAVTPDTLAVDSLQQLKFTTRSVWLTSLMIISLGLYVLALAIAGPEHLHMNEVPTFVRWIMGLMGALFVFGGMSSPRQRQQFTFDATRQTFYRRHWDKSQRRFTIQEIPYSQCDSLSLNTLQSTFSDKDVSSGLWQISLHFKDSAQPPLLLFSFSSENKTRAFAEKIMQQLNIPLKDTTRDTVETLTSETIQLSLSERQQRGNEKQSFSSNTPVSDLYTPPSRFLQCFTEPNGGTVIDVRSRNTLGGNLLMMFFALFWNAVLGFMLYQVVRSTMNGELGIGKSILMFLFFVPFCLIGLALIGAFLQIVMGDERVRCSRDGITIEARIGGYPFWKTTVESAQILDISIDRSHRSRSGKVDTVLKIRTRKQNSYQLGSSLQEEELRWLELKILAALN